MAIKHRHKIAGYVKLHSQLAGTSAEVTETLNLKAKVLKELKPGWVPLTSFKIKKGIVSDDFVQDMLTIVAEKFVIRAPRFMYNRYLRLKKSTRNLVQ